MSVRESVHQLVEELPEDRLRAKAQYILPDFKPLCESLEEWKTRARAEFQEILKAEGSALQQLFQIQLSQSNYVSIKPLSESDCRAASRVL
jgi:hypothetical protein